MKYALHSILIIFFVHQITTGNVVAQSLLKPSIGLSSLPKDGDSICTIPLAVDPGNIFIEPGLHTGDTIPDFKLYTLENDSMHIADLLADGKPVLLIGGSFTCPVFRNHLNQVDDLVLAFGDQIHIYIIYTVEAHPDSPDISPYKGEVWQLNSNKQLGIHYHEPVTYLDRKIAATDMLSNLDISVPVLLDGPCNQWWETFALSPNPSFLIQPNGIIVLKQGWFENNTYAISTAIESLLQTSAGIQENEQAIRVVNDPSSPAIQFIFSEPASDLRFELIDMTGRIVETPFVHSVNTFTLNKQDFPPGIYLYSIESNVGTVAGKIFID